MFSYNPLPTINPRRERQHIYFLPTNGEEQGRMSDVSNEKSLVSMHEGNCFRGILTLARPPPSDVLTSAETQVCAFQRDEGEQLVPERGGALRRELHRVSGGGGGFHRL